MDADDAVTWAECRVCGAIVGDDWKHKEWHRENGDDVSTLGDTVADAAFTLAGVWIKDTAARAKVRWNGRKGARGG